MRDDCIKITTLIPGYVDGKLKPEEMAAVTEHLKTCSDCQKEAQRMQQMVSALKNLSTERIPFNLWPSVAEKIAERQKHPTLFPMRIIWRVAAIPTAAALAALLFFNFRPSQPPSNPAASKPQSVSKEYQAYIQAYSRFRGAQPLSDRGALTAAAQLHPQEQKVE